MVTAVFNGSNTARARGLWQYDYGQILRIQGLSLPTAVEIDFSLRETGGESTTRVGITQNGVTNVTIPDSMIENNGCAGDYCIYAFIYITDETSGETTHKIIMPVNSRPKPEAYSTPEDAQLFRDAIAEVNRSAETSNAAAISAEAWAHGHADYPERDKDNAKYYAGQARNDAAQTQNDRNAVSELSEHVNTVAMQVDADKTEAGQYMKQAAASAADALQSEQAAKTSETAAREAMSGAEAAEGQAELFAAQAKEDKATVEQVKDDVAKIGQEVTENKNYVNQTVAGFKLLHRQAVEDVNNAGQVQTERVEGAGDQAVKDINAAGTTQINAINSAGEQQVKAVEDAGSAQVSAVQEAAAEIIADREQIAENKSGISELKGDLVELDSNKLDKFVYESVSELTPTTTNNDFAVGLNGAGKPVSGESVVRYAITIGKKYRITGHSDTAYGLYAFYTSATWGTYVPNSVVPNNGSNEKNIIVEAISEWIFISRGTYTDIKLEEVTQKDIFTTVPTDKTLTQDNVPADAKAVGDKFADTSSLVGTKVEEYFEQHPEIGNVEEQFRDTNSTITYGNELLTGATVTLGANWSGNLANGFTHAKGSNEPITFNVGSIDDASVYAFQITTSNARLDGYSDFKVSLCGSETFETYKGGGSSVSYIFGLISGADGTGTLVITPKQDYDGTITNLSLKKIETVNVAHTSVYTDHNGIDCSEIRLNGFDNNLLAIGLNSGQKNFYGGSNTVVGKNSLANNTDGFWNTALGYNTLNRCLHGSRNVAIGFIALQGLTTGDRNIAIGTFAMGGLTTGRNNIAIGADAMQTGNGNNNISIGTGSGGTGSFNTSIGGRAGNATKGLYNIFIGHQAGEKATTGGGNIIIGAGTNLDSPTDSNVTLIGRTNTKKTRVYGDFEVQGTDGIRRKIIFNEDGSCSWVSV